eukprot:gene14012-14130_t
MFLGLDLGTSAVKAVLIDESSAVVAEASEPLSISRPRPLWSEQNAPDFWIAVCNVLDSFKRDYGSALAKVKGIGLSGQMHGAVVLDKDDVPVRPVILWNDGRSGAECAEFARHFPHLPAVTGVIAMPGFTAPKLLWLKRNEPENFARIRCILLPKDYLRLKLTGVKATEMSDAAGTWWLDEARRAWSDEALAATGVTHAQMPVLLEGNAISGTLLPELAARWGMGKVIVAGGAGDAAAGAIGLGAISDGDAFISLGTSGQLFAATNSYRPAPDTLVHAFAHAVPNTWLQMAAMLNGASPLAWGASLMGTDPTTLVQEAQAQFKAPTSEIFLPYLSGERTPHNNPDAKGVFFGLSGDTNRGCLGQSILEGVAYSFADAQAAVKAAGTTIHQAGVIGGGAKSTFWMQILSNVLDIPLIRYAGADKGPAFGAARLARLAVTGESPADVCVRPGILDVTEPQKELVEAYRPKIAQFRRLYAALKAEFSAI